MSLSRLAIPLAASHQRFTHFPVDNRIAATLKARGEPARILTFRCVALPLSLADARPVTCQANPTLEYVLRAGVNGYNVDASVTFASEPTEQMFRKAEEQIARLVVAPAAITIAVRPTIRTRRPARQLRVGVQREEGREGHREFRECGLLPNEFRDHAKCSQKRAAAGRCPQASSQRHLPRRLRRGRLERGERAGAGRRRLKPVPPRQFQVQVVERSSFRRKRVVVQRYNRRTSRWANVKTLRLEHQGAAPGSVFVWSESDEFAVKLPKGATLRADAAS